MYSALLPLWTTMAVAQPVRLSCPDDVSLFAESTNDADLVVRHAVREDCDMDPKRVYGVDARFTMFVENAVMDVGEVCKMGLPPVDPALSSVGGPLYTCPGQCVESVTPLSSIDVVWGTHQPLPGWPLPFLTCSPRVVQDGNPALGCWVDLDCKVDCRREVTASFECVAIEEPVDAGATPK